MGLPADSYAERSCSIAEGGGAYISNAVFMGSTDDVSELDFRCTKLYSPFLSKQILSQNHTGGDALYNFPSNLQLCGHIKHHTMIQ